MDPEHASSGSRDLSYQDLEDETLNGTKQSGGGRSGKGREGRKGGGRGAQGREVQISKALSRLLRHQAENAGIKLDEAGFAPLDKVVSHWSPDAPLEPRTLPY